MFKVFKFIDRNQNGDHQELTGGRNGELVFNGGGVSVLRDEKVLKRESQRVGHGWTTAGSHTKSHDWCPYRDVRGQRNTEGNAPMKTETE